MELDVRDLGGHLTSLGGLERGTLSRRVGEATHVVAAVVRCPSGSG